MASLDSVNLDQVVDYRAEYTAVIQKYKITGDNLVGLCPFHQDRNDSFSVDLKTGKWHCFAEDEGGNFVTFWAKYQGIDTKEAYKEILARYGITPEHERQAQSTNASGLGSYTLERYSFDKRLPADFLRDTCRVDTGRDRDGTEYLRMPYFSRTAKKPPFGSGTRKGVPLDAGQQGQDMPLRGMETAGNQESRIRRPR